MMNMTYLWLIWSRVVLRHGVLCGLVCSLLSIRDVAHFGSRLIAHLVMWFAIVAAITYYPFEIRTATLRVLYLTRLQNVAFHSYSVLFQMWRLNSLSLYLSYTVHHTLIPITHHGT